MSHREQLILFWAAIWLMVCYISSRKFRESLDADRWADIEAESKQWNI